MLKKYFSLLIITILVGAMFNHPTKVNAAQPAPQTFFKARIISIINEKEQVGLDGIKSYVQTIKLKGIEGEEANKDIIVENSEFNIIGPNAYKKGDLMLLANSKDENGDDHFYIVDYVRQNPLYFLFFLFIAMVLILGKRKGFQALLALTASIIIIIWYIIPQIAHGGDPVIISTIGAIGITIVSLYITYGWKTFTHIGAVSIGLSLIITVMLSAIFTELTKLTGTTDEQISYLSQLLGANFNAKGLLLASFIIGALGVLDDVVINQISLIEELHKLDPRLHWHALFKKGLKVGIDHISAIVNTLFLAYVGASLPLLLLFSVDQVSKYDFSTIINMELITTEIVRTLTGSLGLMCAVPISTLIAAVLIPKYGKYLKLSDTPTHHHHA